MHFWYGSLDSSYEIVFFFACCSSAHPRSNQ